MSILVANDLMPHLRAELKEEIAENMLFVMNVCTAFLLNTFTINVLCNYLDLYATQKHAFLLLSDTVKDKR